MYDIAIVGGGPAGLAAAVNARRRNKETVLISKEPHSSKLTQSHQIDNYLGISQVSGSDLSLRMREHAEKLDTIFLKDEIQSIYYEEQSYHLFGRENSLEARTVILAVGISLGAEIDGEIRLTGKGVSYCATCDGMFFKGKTVALIGYIPEAEHEAAFLAEVCAKVYYLPQYKMTRELDPKITIISGKPLAILGSERVEALKTTQDDYPLDGVFIERANRPVDQLLNDLRTESGMILVDSNQATNLPGVFAAGDCTGKPWQISRAVGQGQIAALSAVQYLDSRKIVHS
jgi:thioredoxin reductase (NADPH)